MKALNKFLNENNVDYAFEIELGKLLMPWKKYNTYLLDKSFARGLSIKTNKVYNFIYDQSRYSAYFNETTPKSNNYMAFDIKEIK